jgi:hypothetical protein
MMSLSPTIIRKSCDELKAEVAGIIFADDLTKSEKRAALADTMSGWRNYMEGMNDGYKVSKNENIIQQAKGETPTNVGAKSRGQETRKEGIKMTALAELNTKAEALRKADPKLTKAMAFEKIYLDPSQRELADRFRAEEKVRKTPMLSRSDQPRSGFVPGAGNDGTHPHGTDSVDPDAYDGNPKGSTHVITTGTDQTQHGDSLDRVWRKYKVAVPGLTPKLFQEIARDIRNTLGFSSGDLPAGSPLNPGMRKSTYQVRSSSPMSDRVAALAGSLKVSHPELSHDDAVARVLSRNKDLATAYAREQNKAM